MLEASPPRRPKADAFVTLWLLLVGALLLLGSAIGWNLNNEHNVIDAVERARLAHQAEVIDKNISQQLTATHRALHSLLAELPFLRAQKNGKLQVNRRLKSLSDALTGVRTLATLDADGTATASNREELIGRNFREREFFQIARRSGDAGVLHLSPPYKTSLGVFAMNLTEVILNERGEFAGLILATLDPDYFTTLLDSVLYTPDMWASLAHADGGLFIMVPARPGVEGLNLDKPGSFRNRHMESGQKATVMTGIVYATGEERMMAQRTIKPENLKMDKALAVGVARDMRLIFAPWRQNAYREGGLYVLLAFASCLGMALYQRRQRYFDRMAADQEVEQQRRMDQYRSIVQSSLDGFWVTDGRGRILDANESSCRMLGYSREELLGLSIADIEADESPEKIGARIRQMIETGHVQFEARHRRKDGAVIDVEVSAQYIAALGEQFFAFVRNITERKRTEALIQASEARYRAVAQSASDAIVTADSTGKIVAWNRGAETLFGHTEAEAMAMPLTALMPQRYRERHLGGFGHVMSGGEPRHAGTVIELAGLHKDGREFPIEASLSHWDVAEGRFVTGIIRDITAREAVLADLKRSNAELEQFSYAISHDMRQPLRMISSYMQLLERGLADQLDAEKREFFDFAVDGAKRLDAMLVGLLDYSRVGRKGEPPAMIESREMLDQALLFLGPAMVEAQAELHIQGDWPRVYVRQDEILRLLQNLIGNALKYRVERRKPEITVTSEALPDEWRVSIADNGVGIIPGQIDRLFQVFQRLQSRADYEGTGIGLALCRKIVEHHGGKIRAESAGEGLGSRFAFSIPGTSPLTEAK